MSSSRCSSPLAADAGALKSMCSLPTRPRVTITTGIPPESLPDTPARAAEAYDRARTRFSRRLAGSAGLSEPADLLEEVARLQGQVYALEKEIKHSRQSGFAASDAARRLQMELDLAHARAQNAEDGIAQLHAHLHAALQQLVGNAHAATCGAVPETTSTFTEVSFLNVDQEQDFACLDDKEMLDVCDLFLS